MSHDSVYLDRINATAERCVEMAKHPHPWEIASGHVPLFRHKCGIKRKGPNGYDPLDAIPFEDARPMWDALPADKREDSAAVLALFDAAYVELDFVLKLVIVRETLDGRRPPGGGHISIVMREGEFS